MGFSTASLGVNMDNQLLTKGWLKREIKISGCEEAITYSGRGIGTEKVCIGESEFVSQSEYDWFVPEFDFEHNDSHYNVQVRVWPWIALRSLEVHQNERLIYSEGGKPYKVTRTTETIQIASWFIIFLTPLLVLSKII